MAKIQKEIITITFSKMLADRDTATDLVLTDHMVGLLQEHAQQLVDGSIIVEAAIQEADEDLGIINWDITDTDDMFVGGFESTNTQPAAEEAPANVKVQAVEEALAQTDKYDF